MSRSSSKILQEMILCITYHYCDFSDPKTLDPCNIFSGFIRQLLEMVVIPTELEDRIQHLYRLGTRAPENEDLAALFISASQKFAKVFIVIDGLDECPKGVQATILSILHQLSPCGTPPVKLLVTSRELDIISNTLKGILRVRISTESISADISSYVDDAVKSAIKSGDLIVKYPSLELEIPQNSKLERVECERHK